MRLIFLLFFLLPLSLKAQISQDSAAFFIRYIYRECFSELKVYDWLRDLTKNIGPRLCGFENAAKADQLSYSMLDQIRMDTVSLQPVRVPRWERGSKEQVMMYSKSNGKVKLNALALGQSPETGKKGVRGSIIEVHSLD